MSITLDKGEITVNGDAAYELEIKRIFESQILYTKTGQAILTKIQAHGEVLIVEDYPHKDRREVNSEFDPAASRKNLAIVVFHPHNKNLNTVRVFLNGKEITQAQLRDLQQHYTGMRPHEILFHELVHAARYLGGDSKTIPIPSMPDYENEEEYFAILVTNIYSSERGESFDGLRKSHDLRKRPEMTEQEAEPWAFLLEDDNYRLIEKFCKQHPNIAPMIAQAPAEFNPIRDYYDLKRGVPPRVILKAKEEVRVPIRTTSHEPPVPVTDYRLLTLLQPRYRANDVAGYGGRARELEGVFAHMTTQAALVLLLRLLARPLGDRVAMYFHDHLATATRKKLCTVLVGAIFGAR